MVDLKAELNELIKEAKPKCKGYYDKIPKGVMGIFIKSIEDRWNNTRREIDLDILLYNQKCEIESLLDNLDKSQDSFKELLKIRGKLK